MPNRLDTILEYKRLEAAALNLAEMRARLAEAPPVRDFLGAVRRLPHGPRRLIAEIKRASPSRGRLAPNLNLEDWARLYADNGAAAISVLTDERFFSGHLNDLRTVRALNLSTPLLRKDFIVHPAQIYEARAAGADAVLLIVAALTQAELCDFHALTRDLGMTALVEVHDPAEAARAVAIPGVQLVGINNRNLATFEVSLATTAHVRPLLPPEVVVVGESGIFTAAEVAALDVSAVLVGEAIVTAPDMAAKVRELAGITYSQR